MNFEYLVYLLQQWEIAVCIRNKRAIEECIDSML